MPRKRKGFFEKPAPKLYLGGWMDRLEVRPVAVAKAVAVGEPYLSELISGKAKDNPSSHLMFEISEFLGISVNDLYRPPPPRAAVEATQRLTPTQIAALGHLLDGIDRPKRKK